MARLLTDPDTARKPEGPVQFEMDSWIDTAPFEDLLNLHIEAVGDGKAILRMPFLLKYSQGGGVMHGGALTTLADTAVAMAIKSLLPEGTVFATTSLSMNFFRPVLAGEVAAIAEVTGPVERTYHGVARILNSDGTEVAQFTSEFRVAKYQSAAF